MATLSDALPRSATANHYQRARFETWLRTFDPIDPWVEGCFATQGDLYIDPLVQRAWVGWKAALDTTCLPSENAGASLLSSGKAQSECPNPPQSKLHSSFDKDRNVDHTLGQKAMFDGCVNVEEEIERIRLGLLPPSRSTNAQIGAPMPASDFRLMSESEKYGAYASAYRNLAGWHQAVMTAGTILGLPGGLGASEFAQAVQDHDARTRSSSSNIDEHGNLTVEKEEVNALLNL